jgi:hypothetical protein
MVWGSRIAEVGNPSCVGPVYAAIRLCVISLGQFWVIRRRQQQQQLLRVMG